MKNYAYNDFGNLITMKTSNSGPQLMGDEVLSHALNSETDAIAETSNYDPQLMWNEVLSHALNSGTNAIAETSNSETNAIAETSNSEVNAIVETSNSSNNASPGDSIGWRDTPITEIDIRTFNPFRFSSEYHDDELNLIYYNYRHYDPATGRFLSRDPIEEQGGTNLYNFTANNPINILDILGNMTWPNPGSVSGITANPSSTTSWPNSGSSSLSINFSLWPITYQYIYQNNGCRYLCFNLTPLDLVGASIGANAENGTSIINISGGISRHVSASKNISLTSGIGVNLGAGISLPVQISITMTCIKTTDTDRNGCLCPEINSLTSR